MTQAILEIICLHFGVKKVDLMTRSGLRESQKIVEAKQVAAHFLWRCTRLTGEQIANTLDYTSKTNVIKARRKVVEIAEGNHSFKADLQKLEKQILRD